MTFILIKTLSSIFFRMDESNRPSIYHGEEEQPTKNLIFKYLCKGIYLIYINLF